LLDQKVTKNQGFIKFQCFSTSGFCHATQAVRHDTVFKQQALGTWLTSAWLADAPRTKNLP
jgi:hypothetical protein